MTEFETEMQAIKDRISSMSPEEQKELAKKLIGLVNEAVFDMFAACRAGSSPAQVMQAGAKVLSDYGKPKAKTLN